MSLKNKGFSKGFTLIELMIVCAIICIIAMILIPSFLRARSSAIKQKKQENTQDVVQVQRPENPSYRNKPEGTVPIFLSEDIKIKFSVEHHRIGMDLYTRFESDFKGQFLFTKKDTKDGIVRLDFKFPLGTTEAKNVSLTFTTIKGSWEPQGVIYDREGIFWTGTIDGNEPVTADVAFTAQGRERFEYSLPPGLRTNQVQIDMEMKGEPRFFIPDWALQPTSTTPEHIIWNFNNLVTDRSVVVELMEAQSPIGRVILMCKLVGIAVLFFGIGFWYLAALYKPEGLSRFRWVHFFPLALTYSLFFLIFGILGFRSNLSIWTIIGISGALSIPLLTLHVSRIIDMKFALTRNLPFSIFNLALVINGVYGGPMRDYLFISAAFIVIAFITITCRKWLSNRDEWLKELEDNLAKKIEDFRTVITDGRELEKKACLALKEPDPSEFSDMRKKLEDEHKTFLQNFMEYESILLDLTKMESLKNSGEREFLRNSLENKMSFLEHQFIDNKNDIQITLEHLLALRETKIKKTDPTKDKKVYCLSCGYGSDLTPYCASCGVVRPKEIICHKCGDSIKIPVHIINMDFTKENIFCITCGEKLSTG